MSDLTTGAPMRKMTWDELAHENAALKKRERALRELLAGFIDDDDGDGEQNWRTGWNAGADALARQIRDFLDGIVRAEEPEPEAVG